MTRASRITIAMILAGCWVVETYNLTAFLFPYTPHVRLFIYPPQFPPDSFWYVKLMCELLRDILFTGAAYRITRQVFKLKGTELFRKLGGVCMIAHLYCWAELALYFVNYGQQGHGLLLIISTAATWILLLNKGLRT